ncbi:MAG TPA: transketolase C-terminal domain-containing protein [Bacteroidales bacterium]|nr:transketolase C-terminal domain-containing protein [Bacteroidales bacterium]
MNYLKQIAMRTTFGESLLELAKGYPEIVVLDADVSSSTQTIKFGIEYPDRFFNVGVAEANMVDMASGFALCGLRPIVSAFSIFLTLKATEQIANVICYNKLPVILVGGYAGLSDSFDGASHQSITDIAIMRSMPNLNVIVPADSIELAQALRQVIKLKTPTYLRISRNPSPVLFEDGDQFIFGKIKRIQEGKDITIAACGITLSIAIEAANELNKKGISADVLNVSTIKPMDIDSLVMSVRKTGKILTVEEHSIFGGLGSAVSETLMKNYPVMMDFIGVNDTFTETGPYPELLDKYHISKESIIEKTIILLSK